MKRDAIFGIVGQLTNSATNFGVQLALISYASKEDYGWYVLVSSYFFLGLGVLNAVINVPLTVVLGGQPTQEKNYAVRVLSFWVILASVGFTLATTIVAAAIAPLGAPQGLAIGFCFGSLCLREFYRSAAFSLNCARRSSVLDFANMLFIASTVSVVLVNFESLLASQVFIIVGISTFLTSLPWLLKFRPVLGRLKEKKKILEHARWALPGVLVIWLQNNAYLTLANMFWGARVVADLGASRLFIMPIATIFGGWSRVFLSKAAHLVADRDFNQINAVKSKAINYLVICHFLVFVLLILLARYAPSDLIPPKYSGLIPFVFIWLFFSLVSTWRGILAQIVQAFGRFDVIFKITVISAITTVLAAMLAVTTGQALALVGALMLGELVLLITMSRHLKVALAQRNIHE